MTYATYNFTHLVGKVRRKTPEEENQQELYYLDNGERRIFPDLEAMKFFLRVSSPSNDSSSSFDEQLLRSIPIISEKEKAESPLRGDPHFYAAKTGLMIKVHRLAAVWFLKDFERRLVPNMDTLYALRPDGAIHTIPIHQMHEIPVGSMIPAIDKSAAT